MITSLDWLTLVVTTDCIDWSKDYIVERQPYNTRHYNFVDIIFNQQKQQLATLVHGSRNEKVIKSNIGGLTFANSQLYINTDVKAFVTTFIQTNRIGFKSISRADVCLDFNTFLNGYSPENFMRDYSYAKILKAGERGKYTVIGKSKMVIPEYLRFGSKSSQITIKLYNKTVELEGNSKPYIKELWQKAGLANPAFRLEFTIKSATSRVFKDNQDIYNLKTLDLLNSDVYTMVYASLLKKFFNFYHNEGQTRLDRNTPLELFDYTQLKHLDTYIQPNDIITSRKHRLQANFLYELTETHTDYMLKQSATNLLNSHIIKYDLFEYMQNKFNYLVFSEL